MPTSESVYQYYLRQQMAIVNYYSDCITYPDTELVHQLRLGIKKIRALNILAHYISIDRTYSVNYEEPGLKHLFKLAGQLRDIQVQIEMLASYEEKANLSFSGFEEWLRKREIKRILRFEEIRQLPENLLEKQSNYFKMGELLIDANDENILRGARKALIALYNKVLKFSSGEILDADLHSIRTIAKQMRYIYSIVQHSFPEFIFNRITIALLREIEVSAGYWHDCHMRYELCGKFLHQLDAKDESTVQKYTQLLVSFKAELGLAYNESSKLITKGFCKKDNR